MRISNSRGADDSEAYSQSLGKSQEVSKMEKTHRRQKSLKF